jgi:hypothetical protein
VKFLLGCAVICAALSAQAEVMRLRWRGVQATGPAPAKLDRAVELHLAIALKQLGTELATAPPVDAEASARCVFTGKTAGCLVEVMRPADGVHVERKQEIPFRDADDLAESLSLLVTELISTELREIVTPREPEPKPAPPVKPPEPPKPSPRVEAPPEEPKVVVRKRPPVPSHGLLEIGPTVAVGFAGEPVLGGAVVRGGWARGVLRVGGTLSITGTSDHRSGYSFSYVRFLTGPRVGAGFDSRRVEGDLTAGPALYVLSIDAGAAGKHTLTSFAGMVGARLGVRLSAAIQLALTVDAAVAAHQEQVQAPDGSTVSQFGLGSLEVALTLAYRL